MHLLYAVQVCPYAYGVLCIWSHIKRCRCGFNVMSPLLYSLQGQMDEDVQKALKQILMMCKMPTEAKLSIWNGTAYLFTDHAGEETQGNYILGLLTYLIYHTTVHVCPSKAKILIKIKIKYILHLSTNDVRGELWRLVVNRFDCHPTFELAVFVL